MTTQFAKASYQEIVDLHTESDTVSVIGIHTPQGNTPRKMFGGFFDQFKKFKYLGCSISLVPAARLPADPLQVSYDPGEATIDPRDMLNPLMFHGCHGNDMGVILNRLYALNSGDMNSDSINFLQDDTQWSLAGIAAGEFPNFQLEDLYYKALTDNTWKKAHAQRGFRKSGLRPLVYKMATNLQMLGSGSSLAGEVGVDGIPMGPAYDSGSISLPVTQSGRQFFTPGLTGLGWLDTRNVLTDFKAVDIDLPITEEEIPDLEDAIRSATLAQQNASESSLPLVYMGMILLPPAYKTEQYFRMIINHHFAFKDFRGISFSNNLATTPAYNNFNDEDSEQGGDVVNPDDPDDPGDGGDDSGGGGSTSGYKYLFSTPQSAPSTLAPNVYSEYDYYSLVATDDTTGIASYLQVTDANGSKLDTAIGSQGWVVAANATSPSPIGSWAKVSGGLVGGYELAMVVYINGKLYGAGSGSTAFIDVTGALPGRGETLTVSNSVQDATLISDVTNGTSVTWDVV